jgi:hypothetical protein
MTTVSELPTIPVVDVGARYAIELVERFPETVHALLDTAAKGVPRSALRTADRISRRWLRRWRSPYLDEIDIIARKLGRPGAHFFNVHYEWGCTTAAKPSPDRATARLVRVLDWKTNGLGRFITAARITGEAGPWISLTWPGFTGALQAMAPGRFAAALNQAPMRSPIGAFYLDWAANRMRVWTMPHPTPGQLLRQVFEQAHDFDTARAMLMETPVSAPGIYTLAGLRPHETCVIERDEETARLILPDAASGTGACAANDWQGELPVRRWARGNDSSGRRQGMLPLEAELDPDMRWLEPPILNPTTRLVMVADASVGRLVARGYEAYGPATKALVLDEGADVTRRRLRQRA